jgi:hypothetical protein
MSNRIDLQIVEREKREIRQTRKTATDYEIFNLVEGLLLKYFANFKRYLDLRSLAK